MTDPGDGQNPPPFVSQVYDQNIPNNSIKTNLVRIIFYENQPGLASLYALSIAYTSSLLSENRSFTATTNFPTSIISYIAVNPTYLVFCWLPWSVGAGRSPQHGLPVNKFNEAQMQCCGFRSRQFQIGKAKAMSYRLDPNTGKFVMTSEQPMWLNRSDDSMPRQLSETSSPSFRNELAKGGIDKFFSMSLGGSMTPQAQYERTYIPGRSFPADQAKNTSADGRSGVQVKEQSLAATRRIVLTNGRRSLEPEALGPSQEARDIGATITRDVGAVLESRVMRDGAATPNYRSLIREPMLPVRQFSTTAESIEKQKLAEMELQIKAVQEQNVLLQNDAELLKGELQNLRESNNVMQVELGSLREMEVDYNKLRGQADLLYDQNTALKNELSLLHGQIEHSNLLKLENAAIFALQQENSNLKSELSNLVNIHNDNSVLESQLAGLRELQQENLNLKTQVSNLRNLMNENNSLKSQLNSIETQRSLLQNQLNLLKSGDKDLQLRQFTENITQQLQNLKADLTSFQGLKRNLQGKFGITQPLTVDDFAQKVYMMLSDNMAMMEALTLKDSQLEEFREKMDQNQKAVEQLSNMRATYEENFKTMNVSQENDRQRILDLTMQLEEQKILQKKTSFEIQRLQSKKNPLEDDETISLIKKKDAEIANLQADLQSNNEKYEKLEKQLERVKAVSEEKLSSDKSELTSTLGSQISSLTAQLDKTRSDCAYLEDLVMEKDKALNELTTQMTKLRQQLRETIEALQATTVDLRRFSELYNLKDKEANSSRLVTEQLRAESIEKIRVLEEQVTRLRITLEQAHLKHIQEQESMLLELENVRGNWQHRLLRELRTFDEALKQQIEQLNILKATVTEKDDKLLQLRDSLFASQAQVASLRSQLELERLHSQNTRKTQNVNHQIQLQSLTNDLNSSNKLAQVLGSKMKQLVDDSKKKDEFIHKYVMGKKLSPEDKFNAQLFFKQYEILVPHANMKTKYEEELRLIDQLQMNNRILTRELAALKSVEPAGNL